MSIKHRVRKLEETHRGDHFAIILADKGDPEEQIRDYCRQYAVTPEDCEFLIIHKDPPPPTGRGDARGETTGDAQSQG